MTEHHPARLSIA
jgi:hypothetical protein